MYHNFFPFSQYFDLYLHSNPIKRNTPKLQIWEFQKVVLPVHVNITHHPSNDLYELHSTISPIPNRLSNPDDSMMESDCNSLTWWFLAAELTHRIRFCLVGRCASFSPLASLASNVSICISQKASKPASSKEVIRYCSSSICKWETSRLRRRDFWGLGDQRLEMGSQSFVGERWIE